MNAKFLKTTAPNTSHIKQNNFLMFHVTLLNIPIYAHVYIPIFAYIQQKAKQDSNISLTLILLCQKWFLNKYVT